MKPDQNTELILKILDAFREYGYEGTSMTILAQLTGMTKAGLYHRFPEGKKHMAKAAIHFMQHFVLNNIEAIKAAPNIEAKLMLLLSGLEKVYQGGSQYCVLNALSMTKYGNNPFNQELANLMEDMFESCMQVALGAGLCQEEAESRAREAAINIKGCLVLTRVTGNTAIYQNMMDRLGRILTGKDLRLDFKSQLLE